MHNINTARIFPPKPANSLSTINHLNDANNYKYLLKIIEHQIPILHLSKHNVVDNL